MYLYGQLGTAPFSSLYRALLSASENITVCLRHYVHHKEGSPVEKQHLSGYGVQLAVKSTEYKAVDDTTVKEGGRGTSWMVDENVNFPVTQIRRRRRRRRRRVSHMGGTLVQKSWKDSFSVP